MTARVFCIAALIGALCVAARAEAASLQHGPSDDESECRSRLSAMAACSSLPDRADADARPCCEAILAFHSSGCMCESYEKAGEAAALEATALLDSLKDSLYVRCPAISGQLAPALPCPARASLTDAADAAILRLPAVSRSVAEPATTLAEPVHDPLFGTHQWAVTTASEDPREVARRVSSASAEVGRYSFSAEDAAHHDKAQALTLSSLEATPLEASSVATIDGTRQPGSVAGIWHQLGAVQRSEGYSGVQLPSGFVVDDLQSSGAALPRQSSFDAAPEATRAALETVHGLLDPEGRGTGREAAARASHRAEGLLVSRYTPGSAAAMERSDEQRHAANAAASAARAAGATQRALARVRAAVDRTDIDATLAAATQPFVGRSAQGFEYQHTEGGDVRPHVEKSQRLFGEGHSDGKHADGAWRTDADRTLDVEFRLTVEDGTQPVVEVITDRGASGYASAASVFAVGDGSAEGVAAPQRAPLLALLLSSFLQRQRGGHGSLPAASRAARRLGPGLYTAHLLRTDGGASVRAADPDSLYRLRLARTDEQHSTTQRLFSPGHLGGGSVPTLRVADRFDLDVDIELLPVASGFPAPAEADAWFADALVRAQTVLHGAAQRAASLHATARAWTCAHRRLLLALLVTQLALTALLALAVRTCPEATLSRQSEAAARCIVISAADEARAQLSQPLLSAEKDVCAANPLHDMLIIIETP